MIDRNDDLIPIGRVPRIVSPHDPKHLSTVVRWITRGVGDPRVRLQTIKIGGRRYTTTAAIDAFVTALSSQSTDHCVRLSQQRQATIRRDDHELDHDGVC